ncbi:MAG: hypothetical protein Q8N81_04575 [bacterium]|nr:hypothetical protein [bacterium]
MKEGRLMLLPLSVSAFAVGFAGAAAIIVKYEPNSAPWWVFLLFYLSFFTCAFGMISAILIFFGGVFRIKTGTARDRLLLLFQAVLLAATITFALWFQSFRILNYYTGILLVVSIGFLELYFINR